MPDMLFVVAEAAAIAAALSLDTLVASFSYGVNKIKVSATAALVINLLCAVILALSLFFGTLLSGVVHERTAAVVCAVILFVMGAVKLFDGLIKCLIRGCRSNKKTLQFKLLSLRFILTVYADPEEADADESKTLSVPESISLGIALSLDSLAVGVGAGMAGASGLLVPLFGFVFGMVAVCLGCRIGRRVARASSLNLSWLSGALLIAMGVIKLMM